VELVRFGELERRIREVVEAYSALKDRNHKLEKLLEEKITELGEANDRLRGLGEEKDAVRTRIDALLGMLRDVEES
jgi:chromosome segregation ATPase